MKRSTNPSVDDDIHHIIKNKNPPAHVSVACVDVTNSLYQNKLHKCDICDKVSRNKYTSLIHNARHIIIPLMKQTYYQCPECLYHYQSLLELNQHIAIKHLSTLNEPITETTSRNITTANIENTPQVIDTKLDVLKSALNSLKKESKSANDNVAGRDSDDNDYNRNFVNGSINIKQKILENDYIQTPNPLSIRNRLLFEDDEYPVPSDLGSDNLLNDLTVDCTVNLELFDAQLFATSENESKNVLACKSVVTNDNSTISDDNSATKEKYSNAQIKIRDVQEMISEVQVKNILKRVEPIENANQSVHYEELMILGQFSCAFCPLIFRNRYEKIIHETSHLNFQKKRLYLCSLCDRFICNSKYGGIKGLRQHKLKKHKSLEPQRMCKDHCQYCGLRYFNYTSHYINYHLIYVCPVCAERFASDDERKQHVEAHYSGAPMATVKDYGGGEHGSAMKKKNDKRLVQICDLCVLAYQKTNGVNFKILGAMEAVWQDGEGFTCNFCRTKCATLKIVEKTTVQTKTSHVTFKECGDEVKKKVYVNSSSEHRKSRKPLSNMERLKNIRHRLKMMSLH